MPDPTTLILCYQTNKEKTFLLKMNTAQHILLVGEEEVGLILAT